MQQFNFNRFLPQPIRSSITPKKFFLYYASFVACLFLIFFLSFTHKLILQRRSANAEQELIVARQKLLDLAKLYAREDITTQMDLADTSPCKFKFSSYLEAVAKAASTNAWLTDINFQLKGATIQLKGLSSDAGSVQEFLSALNSQLLFKYNLLDIQKLDSTQLSNDATTSNYLNFVLVTKGTG